MLQTIIRTAVAIFGVMDPVGNVPVFLSLTATMSVAEKRAVAFKAVFRSAVILLFFTFFGSWVLDAFKISFESFRIASGLVLIYLGFQILFGFRLHRDAGPEEDISVVPLAMPLIAGPGTITTAVIFTREFGYLPTLAGLGANLLLSLVLFKYAHLITRLIGRKGSLVFARVMGLILVAIGVEFARAAII